MLAKRFSICETTQWRRPAFAQAAVETLLAVVGPMYHRHEMAQPLRLTPEEELKFQQFQEIDFWRSQSEAQNAGVLSDEPTDAAEGKTATLPDRWELTRNIVLHDWQS